MAGLWNPFHKKLLPATKQSKQTKQLKVHQCLVNFLAFFSEIPWFL